MKMIAKDIRKKKIEELVKLLNDTSLEHFKLKMQLTTGQLPTHNKVRETRKNIALIKTIINEKRISNGTS
tara:strand:+ start:165 stop:374 length:210 start_codon:yes stop_codon:yes gene_type:complete